MEESNVVDQKENVSKEIEPKNKKKNIFVIVILLLAVGLFFFFSDKSKSNNTKLDEKKENNIENIESEESIKYRLSGNGLENFDLKLLQLEASDKNIVYSPLSIKYALLMLRDGAKGTSKSQIDDLIGDYQVKKYINSSNMSFANAMFINNTFRDSIQEKYKTSLKDKYDAEIVYDTFETPDNINSWINDKTLGLINNMVDDVKNKKFYLINALAIDMEWKRLMQATYETWYERYDVNYLHENYSTSIPVIGGIYGYNQFVNFNNKSNTKVAALKIGASINNYDIVSTLGEDNIRQTITKEYSEWLANEENLCGGDEHDVNTYVNNFVSELNSNYKKIDVSTDFKFYIDDDVKAFSKELKEYNGTALEYIGIMPRNKNLKKFIKDVNANSINEIIGKMKDVGLENFEKGKVTKIIGSLPIFKYDYQLKLLDDLKKIGINDVFSKDKTDLSGISESSQLNIDDVKHESNIEFSNVGIKASAFTAEGGSTSAHCGFEHIYEVPVVTIDLTFDNPYLYIIRDKNSKEVWFVGSVYQPMEDNRK